MALLDSGGAAGVIKLYKPRQGFGFIKPASGPDVFVHKEILNAAGIQHISEGTRVWFESGPDAKKPGKVSCVRIRLAGEETGAENESGCEPMALKWFNPGREYGFFKREGKPDVFVHVSTIRKSGLAELAEGVVYQVTFGPSARRGLEAKIIEPHQ